MPYLSVMTHHCRNRELTVRMVARYDLEAEHVSFITGSGKSTNKVAGIVEEARERAEAEAVEHSGGAFASADDEDDASAPDESENGGSGTLADFGGSGDDSASDSESEESDERTDDAAAEPADRAEEAEADDGQAGLSDFM